MDYLVIHRCGHEQHHAIFWTFAAEAERVVERLARQQCAPCWRTDKQSAGRQINDADKIIPESVVLATLAGSPKQVEWAEKIRATRLASLQRAGHRDSGQLAAVDQAKWWIDHRDRQDTDLLSLCTQALPA